MFDFNKNITVLKPKTEEIFEIFSSINAPLVAVAEFPTEPSRAYIITIKNKRKLCDFYIYLNMLNSNRGIFYTLSSISDEHYSATKLSAFDFVESMGFLMERTYSQADGIDKAKESLKTMPMFGGSVEGAGTEEVIQLEEAAVEIEIKDIDASGDSKPSKKVAKSDSIDILLDELADHEKTIMEKPKKPIIGKIDIKSIKMEKTADENAFGKFKPFFVFLSSL